MERLGLRKGTGYDEEKQASNWVSLLCRPYDSRKTGVRPELLPWISLLLDVRANWLTGQDDFRTNEELLQAYETAAAEKEKTARAAVHHDYINLNKSPVYALIKDRLTLTRVGLDTDGTSPCIEFTFADDPHSYRVTLQTLHKIENACAALCCSVIKNRLT